MRSVTITPVLVRGREFVWSRYKSGDFWKLSNGTPYTDYLDIRETHSAFRVIVRVVRATDHEYLYLGPLMFLDATGVNTMTPGLIGERVMLRPRFSMITELVLQDKHVEAIVQWLLSDGFRPVKSDRDNLRVRVSEDQVEPNKRIHQSPDGAGDP